MKPTSKDTVDFSKGYPCPMCGKLFPTWEALDKHATKEADSAMKIAKPLIKKANKK